MICPKCESYQIQVMDTMPGRHNAVYRRRRCKTCGTLFRTVETVDDGSDEFAKEFHFAQSVKNGYLQ